MIDINKEDVGIIMTALTKSVAYDIQMEIKRLIKMESGYATGEYERSIEVKQTSDGFEVYTEKEYGPYLEWGTGLFVAAGHGTPHRIVPTKSSCLTWIDRRTGKRVFAKSVKGIEPRFYFTKSVDLVNAKYNNDVTRKIANFIEGKSKIAIAERFEKTGLVIGR